MALKDWKNKKISGYLPGIEWKNKKSLQRIVLLKESFLPKIKNHLVHIKSIGEKHFKNKTLALKYAKSYMKKH